MTSVRPGTPHPRTAAEEGAYRAGYRVGYAGADADSPYPIGSKLRRHWQEGWMHGERAWRSAAAADG